MTRLWIVRAGKQGDRELATIEQDRLLPGFLDVGDLRRFPDRDAILEHLEEEMPDGGRNRLRNFAAQLNQFAHTIQVGDLVVMPQSSRTASRSARSRATTPSVPKIRTSTPVR